MQSSLSDRFAYAVASNNPSRLSRLLHSPFHLLYSKCLESYATRRRIPVFRNAMTFWGDEMEVVFPERVSMTIYRYHYYERGLTEIILNTLKQGMVFFDVGAHFGYYSLMASALVGESGEVHSFEPTPSTFDVLRRNTKAKPRVHINNLALWSNTETLHFHDYGVAYSAFNSIQGGGVENKMRQGIESVPCDVQATTVDEYVKTTGAIPSLLKLDAEGAELSIVQGMSETIERARPMLTVEVGDDPNTDETYSRSLLDTIIAKGYQPYEARDGRVVRHELLLKYKYDNILLVPT